MSEQELVQSILEQMILSCERVEKRFSTIQTINDFLDTEEGIEKLLKETSRLAKKASFHMVPVSKTNKDEGWKKTFQSFHNNSVEWWVSKYSQSYGRVHVIDSGWSDHMSIGKWFLCYN